VLAAFAACAATLLALPSAAQTAFTTGAIEVRGFYARAAGNVFAAGYGSGLFRSTDGLGATWTRQPLPANERYLTSVAGNTNLVIVGAEEGLLRSTDSANFTRTFHEPVSAVAVAPTGTATTTVVLAAVRGAGVFRSTDGGQTFTLANIAAMGSTDITGLAIDPANANNVYASVMPTKLGVGGGVYRSTDGGATWSNHNLDLPAAQQYLAAVTVDSTGTPYIGVLRPDNQGDVYFRSGASNWVASGDVFGGVASLHRDANSGGVIWAGGRGFGLLTGATNNFNYAYAGVGAPNLLFTGVNATVSLPGTAVVLKGLRGAGVWRSTAAGAPRAWSRLTFPGADRVLSASNVGASATAMVAGLHAGGLWRTADAAGGVWAAPNMTADPATSDFNFAIPGNFQSVVPFASIWDIYGSLTNANLAYAAAGGVGMFYGNDGTGVFRWNGTRWGVVNDTGLPLGGLPQPYGVALNSNDTLAFAASLSNNGVRRLSGGTWTNVAVPGGPTDVRRVVVSPSNANKVLALLFDDKPAISTNGGTSYTQVTVSQTGFERIRFFSAAESHANSLIWIGGTNKGLFRSTDGGTNWARVSSATFVQHAITAVGSKQSNGRLFAADIDGNRYCSTDGNTWVSAGTKLRAGVNAIRTFGGNLYYLTDGAGIFREDGTC
jgi:hypothetical protein